jgi:hypothetical protein
VNAIKIKASIIDSPIDLIVGRPTIRDNNLLLKCMNQILWGRTKEKWVADKNVTPAQFKKADAKLLNSIVDSILIESEDQSGEVAQASPSTERETFTNCVACYTLVTHEECA